MTLLTLVPDAQPDTETTPPLQTQLSLLPIGAGAILAQHQT